MIMDGRVRVARLSSQKATLLCRTSKRGNLRDEVGRWLELEEDEYLLPTMIQLKGRQRMRLTFSNP